MQAAIKDFRENFYCPLVPYRFWPTRKSVCSMTATPTYSPARILTRHRPLPASCRGGGIAVLPPPEPASNYVELRLPGGLRTPWVPLPPHERRITGDLPSSLTQAVPIPLFPDVLRAILRCNVGQEPQKCSTAIKSYVEELSEVLPRLDPQNAQIGAPRWSGRRLKALGPLVVCAARGEQLQAILEARGLVAGAERAVQG
jgi:hypothetical protein